MVNGSCRQTGYLISHHPTARKQLAGLLVSGWVGQLRVNGEGKSHQHFVIFIIHAVGSVFTLRGTAEEDNKPAAL
jgi:hypothetical protein